MHYTVAFLLLACLHLIIVLCYPAHGTHIYQGLDVIIFAILRLLSKEHDKLLWDTGKVINKSKFLSIITNAYIQALTSGNIKTAFCNTGIHPFNPEVVTSDMHAPSKETSLKANMPVENSDAAKLFADMLCRLQDLEEAKSDSKDADRSDSQLVEEQEIIVRADMGCPHQLQIQPLTVHVQPTPSQHQQSHVQHAQLHTQPSHQIHQYQLRIESTNINDHTPNAFNKTHSSQHPQRDCCHPQEDQPHISHHPYNYNIF